MEKHNGDFSVAVMVEKAGKILMVRNPTKRGPVWKFPGGKRHGWESPEDCATRELFAETGLKVRHLELVTELDRGTHTFYLFYTNRTSSNGLKKVGTESGQKILEIKRFEISRILRRKGFLDLHVDFAEPKLIERLMRHQ
jgi:ADP-ribose pyrophosphatase YjhB (NUDIX family)